MKRIFIIGAGRVGTAMAADLAATHEVWLGDVNHDRLLEIAPWAIANGIKDLVTLRDEEELQDQLRACDMVINAVPGFLGYGMLEKIIKAKRNVVDISFFLENPKDLHDLAVLNGVAAVVDCGVAPGLDNIILGKILSEWKEVRTFECMVGGLPVERKMPFQYKAPFSPIDVIEEYVRPARVIKQGRQFTMEPLTEIEHVEFPGIGTLEAFNTDGLRTLLNIDVDNMVEKTLRYPGHADQIKMLKAAGFLDKEHIDNTSKVLFKQWKLGPDDEDMTVFRTTLKGWNAADEEEVLVFQFIDRKTDGVSSMSRTTGYTATAVANLMLDGKITKKGIVTPEEVGAIQGCFEFVMKYLEDRKVPIEMYVNGEQAW